MSTTLPTTRRGRWSRLLILTGAVAIAICLLSVWGGTLFGTADPALREAARAAAAESHWDDADAALARLRRPNPDDWLLRAVVADGRKRDDEALDYLGHVPPDGPRAAEVALITGQVERRRHHARAMEAALLRALRLNPSLVDARKLLIYIYGVQERRPELMAQFAALAEKGPLTLDLVADWCLSRGDLNEPAEVRDDLRRFVAADPDDRLSRLALAEVERKLANLDAARSALEPLPDADPDARAARARIAFDRGEIEAAATLLADGPADHAELDRLRGRLALTRRDAPAAVRWYRAADAAEPNDRDTLFGLGQALRLAGEATEASEILRRAAAHQALRNQLVAIAGKSDLPPETLIRLAAACAEVGRQPEARAWYRLILAADPLNADAQQGLYQLGQADPGREPGVGRPAH